MMMSLFFVPAFFVHANEKPLIYIYGDHEYRRNGLIPFTSEEDVVLHAVGHNLDTYTVKAEIYRSEKKDLLEYLVYGEKRQQIRTAPHIDADKKIGEMNVGSGGERFRIDVDAHGIFVVKVSAGEAVAYAFVVRSQNGAIVTEGKDGLLVWVQDFKDGKRVAGAKCKVYGLRDTVDKRREFVTDSDGIAHMDTSKKYDVITVEKDDDIAVIPVHLRHLNDEYASTENQYPGQMTYAKYHTFTDRPLYKPGDTVHFKSIVRNDNDFAYAIPHDGTWRAQIVTGWGDEKKVLIQGQYTVDSYGTLSGDLVLPEDASTGMMRLEVSRTDKKEQHDDWYWGESGSTVYFHVEHYRKPEYDISLAVDKDEVYAGEKAGFSVRGAYFSGETLSGGDVTYTIYESDFWDGKCVEDLPLDKSTYAYYQYFGKEVGKGQAVLDAQGYTHVPFVPQPSDGKVKVYTVEVRYAQENGEPVIDRENVLVYPSAFGVYHYCEKTPYNYTVGKKVDMTVQLSPYLSRVDLNKKTLSVAITRTWWEKDTGNLHKYAKYVRKEEQIDTFTTKTNRDGRARIAFTPHTYGSYTIAVTGTDDEGRSVTKEFHLWVSAETYVASDENDGGISIETNKERYEPGDTIHATITARENNRDVLVTKERDFVHEYHVVHLDDATKDMDFVMDDTAMPHMTLRVAGFDRNRAIAGQKIVHISSDKQKMDITVHTDKDTYQPGDTVVADVVTRDHTGKPVKADVTLWAVDKALFELILRDDSDVFATFWGEDVRRRYANNSDSLAGITVSGAEMGGGGDDGPRNVLKDVAYWNPRVRTGDDGKAQVRFVIPDNLTTWAVTAIGTTKDTVVGQTFAEFVTTKPVIVRPYIPNILRKDDHVTVVATVHNFTNADRTFDVQLDFDGGTVAHKTQKVTIAKDDRKIVSWDIVPQKENATAHMTFTATATDDKRFSDGIEQKIMIEQYGFRETDSFVHPNNTPYDIHINSDAFNDKTHVELTVAASMLHALSDAMQYLITYPYGCMEQTTSALVSLLLVKDHPEIFAHVTEGKDIDAMIKHGIERLEKNQNPDGGWGWWGNGASDVFISTYVTETLLRAQAVGADVDQGVIDKAQTYFSHVPIPQADAMRSYETKEKEKAILYAYGQSLFADTALRTPVHITEDLTPDIVAMGVMANVRSGHTDKNTNGYNVLVSQLRKKGNNYFLQKGYPRYFASTDTSTALGAMALMFADADMETIQSMMHYLVARRQKAYWSHTFATAQVIDAMMLFSQIKPYDVHNGGFQVMLDGKVVHNGTVGMHNPVTTVRIPVDAINKNGSTLSIKTDNPALYTTLRTDQFRTSKNADAVSRDISITRTYHNVKGKNYSIGVGDTVEVTLRVDGLGDDARYVMVEDYLPAGMVPINERFENAAQAERDYMVSEYGKSHVIFSQQWSHKSHAVYTYRARVVSAGDFATPPAHAFLMYSPEVYARTASQVMHIEKESQVVNIDGTEKQKRGLLMRFLDWLRSGLYKIMLFIGITAVGIGVVIILVKKT